MDKGELAGINGKLDKILLGTTALTVASKQNFQALSELGTKTLNSANTAGAKVEAVSNKMTEKFDKLSKRLNLPELMNAITMIVVLHNAAMLSRDLLQTLGSIVSNGLALVGLKNEDGQPHDINALLGKTVNDYMKSLLGEAVWNGVKTDWDKATKVYSATTNLLNNVTNIGNTILNGMEMIGGNVGKVGNALQRSGAVLGNSYLPMSTSPNYHSKIFTWLENAQQGASTVQQISQVPLDIIQQYTETVNQAEELRKSVIDLPGDGQNPPSIKGQTDPGSSTQMKFDSDAKEVSKGTIFEIWETFNNND